MDNYSSDVHPLIEAAFQEGVQAERDRCKALTKILTPETRLVIVKAVQKGLFLNDVLDECLSILKAQPPATRSDVLTQAVTHKFTAPGNGNGKGGSTYGKSPRPPSVT